jgi:hypothetical protein
MVMGKVIEFHVPAIFHKPLKRRSGASRCKGHRVLHADEEIRLNREDHCNLVASKASSPLVQELGGRISVRL